MPAGGFPCKSTCTAICPVIYTVIYTLPVVFFRQLFWRFFLKKVDMVAVVCHNENVSEGGEVVKRRRQRRGNKERSFIDLTPAEWDVVDKFIEEFTVARRQGMSQSEFFSLLLEVGKDPLNQRLEEEKSK